MAGGNVLVFEVGRIAGRGFFKLSFFKLQQYKKSGKRTQYKSMK